MNKITRALSIAFMTVGAIILFLSISSSDPECYYTTGFFLQSRFCEEAYVDKSDQLDLIYYAGSIILLVLGIILFKRTSKKDEE